MSATILQSFGQVGGSVNTTKKRGEISKEESKLHMYGEVSDLEDLITKKELVTVLTGGDYYIKGRPDQSRHSKHSRHSKLSKQ